MTEEQMKNLINKNCSNFVKMINLEKSELIKINFWITLEELFKKSKLDTNTLTKIIFENIINKEISIFTNKNLIFVILNFMKNYQKNYSQNFYSLFFKSLLQFFNTNNDKNKIYIDSYLLDISFRIFFDNNFIDDDKNKEIKESQFNFYITIIDTDYKIFDIALYKYLYQINDYENLLVSNEKYLQLLGLYSQKLIEKMKLKRLIFLLEQLNKITNYSNEGLSQFYSFLIKGIMENSKERHFKKNKNINLFIDDYLIINQILLKKILDFKITTKMNNDKIDTYLLCILNFLIDFNYLDIKILDLFLVFFNSKKYKNFNYILPICLYYFSEYIYTEKHVNFYLTKILKNDSLNYLIKNLILKKCNLYNKFKYISNDDKNNISSVIYKLEIINEINKNYSFENKKNNNNLFYDNNNNNLLFKNFPLLSRLSLLNNFFLDEIINIELEKVIINTNNLINFLKSLENLHINQIENCEEFFKFLCTFLMELIFIIIELSIKSKIYINSEIIKIILNIISNSSLEFQSNNMYPIILQIIRTSLTKSYDLFFDNNIQKNIIIDLFFNYLINTFAKNDYICAVIFKMLFGFSKEKNIIHQNYLIFIMDKLIDLCLKSNDLKIVDSSFNFIKTLFNEKKDYLVYYSIYIYSEKYEGALYDPILNFILDKFKKYFDEENLNNINENFDLLFCISCLSNFFIKDKPTHLTEYILSLLNQNKLISLLDKIIKKIESLLLNNNNNDNSSLNTNCNNLIEKWEFINNEKLYIKNFNKFILDKLYIQLNIKKNQSKYINNMTYYLSLFHYYCRFLSECLSFFISKISSNPNNKKNVDEKKENVDEKEEEEEEKEEEEEENNEEEDSNQKNDEQIYNHVMTIFEFIYCNIFMNQKNKLYYSILINEIFIKKNTFDLFLKYFSNLQANMKIKKMREEDIESIDYSEVPRIENEFYSIKNNKIFSLIYEDLYNFIYLYDLIDSIFNSEMNNYLSYFKEENNNNNNNNNENIVIIKTIWENHLLLKDNNSNIIKEKYEEKINKKGLTAIQKNNLEKLQFSFVYIFLKSMFETSNLEKNQEIFLFCLDHEIFTNYFMTCPNLLNLDYILIEFYSILLLNANRMDDININLRNKFFKFLNAFIHKGIISVHNFYLRMLSTEKIFVKFFIENSAYCNKFDIDNDVVFLLSNLIIYNSYQKETSETICNIINNIKNFLNSEKYQINEMIYFYGKMLLIIINLVMKKEDMKNDTNNNINNNDNIDKNKINLYKDKNNNINPTFKNKIINKMKDEYIPNYLDIFYNQINLCFTNNTDILKNIKKVIENKRIFETENNNDIYNVENKNKIVDMNKINLSFIYDCLDILINLKNIKLNDFQIFDVCKNEFSNINKFISEIVNICNNIHEMPNVSLNNLIKKYSEKQNENDNNFFRQHIIENLLIYVLIKYNNNISNFEELIILCLDKDEKDYLYFAYCLIYYYRRLFQNKINNNTNKNDEFFYEKIFKNLFKINSLIGKSFKLNSNQ